MKKRVIGKLEKCYSIAPLMYQGKRHTLVAAEKTDRCILFDENGNEEATVWEGPGGVMSMVQVPGTDGEFLATHKFYSPNDSKDAKIIMAVPTDRNVWEVRTLVDLPFVHRFDIIESGEERYLIACTLKSGHEYKDDWSKSGRVYVAKLPENLQKFNEENQLKLEVLKEGLLKNHGYYKIEEDGVYSAIVSCDNGIYRFYPPTIDHPEWEEELILDTPASDATLIDLDGDGKKELVVIAPFHGDEITIYKKKQGHYEKIYEFYEKAEFLHAIWSGTIADKPVVVLGHRKGARKLIIFMWDGEKICYKVIDENCGTANVYGYHLGEKDILIATNREINEIAMYEFVKGEL